MLASSNRYGILRIYRNSMISNNIRVSSSILANASASAIKLHAKTSMNKVVLRFNSLKNKNNFFYPYNVCIRSLASIPNDVNSNVNKTTTDVKDEKSLTMGEKIKKMWKNYGKKHNNNNNNNNKNILNLNN